MEDVLQWIAIGLVAVGGGGGYAWDRRRWQKRASSEFDVQRDRLTTDTEGEVQRLLYLIKDHINGKRPHGR